MEKKRVDHVSVLASNNLSSLHNMITQGDFVVSSVKKQSAYSDVISESDEYTNDTSQPEHLLFRKYEDSIRQLREKY